MNDHYMRRQSDEFGFIRKNWPLLVAVCSLVAGYSALCWSVRDHHSVDNLRDAQLVAAVIQDEKDIVALKEIVKSIPRIESKIDDIMERMPRKR